MRIAANYIYPFFWWFSGTKREFIEPFKTEHQKYFHIGTTIFITWIIATTGGITLFQFVFLEAEGEGYNTYISYVLGIIWGIVILNIDRYMIITIKKRGSSLRRNLTGRERISNFMSELYPSLPRFFIAFLLGIFISTPLELKLFEEDIKNNEEYLKSNLTQKYINNVNIKYNLKEQVINAEIQFINNNISREIDNLEKQRDSQIKERDNSEKEMENNKEGKNGKIAGTGPFWKKSKARNEQAKENIHRIDKHLEEFRTPYTKGKDYSSPSTKKLLEERQKNQDERKKLQEARIAELKSYKPEVNNLSAKIQILSLLKKNTDIEYLDNKSNAVSSGAYNKDNTDNKNMHNKYNSTIFWTDLLLKMFVIIIETSPILFKLLSPRGPVESYIDMISSEAMLEHDALSKKTRLNHSRKISTSTTQKINNFS